MVGRQSQGFAKVAQVDGYPGWADIRFLKELSKAEYKKVKDSANVIVTSAEIRITDKMNKPVPPHFLYYGTKLKAVSTLDGRYRTNHPVGGTVYIKRSSVKPIKKAVTVTGQKLVKEAGKWLGVPYLWGGTSPAGFDCSGFLKQVLDQFGISLPRDTEDQISVGRKVAREGIKVGDLLFFERHVGLALTRDKMIHCSVGSGGVRIESIQAGQPDYREDLDKTFAQARRLL